MSANEWPWQGSFPFLAWDLSMQPRTQFEFSTNLYALEHVHVVQIWIMHINALKTQLMHKMSKWTMKIPKNWQNTPVVLCWHEKKIESNKRQWISFRPQRCDVPYRNHLACCEQLWFVRSISPNLPQMGQYFYHGMLMLLHDSMPSFMNFRWVLDLLEFINQVSQCLRTSDGGRVFEIPSHFLRVT